MKAKETILTKRWVVSFLHPLSVLFRIILPKFIYIRLLPLNFIAIEVRFANRQGSPSLVCPHWDIFGISFPISAEKCASD